MPVAPLKVTVPGLKRKQGAAGILSDRFPKAACTLVRRKSVRGRKSESPSQWFEVRQYNTMLRARGYRLFTSSGRISGPTCSYRPSVGGNLSSPFIEYDMQSSRFTNTASRTGPFRRGRMVIPSATSTRQTWPRGYFVARLVYSRVRVTRRFSCGWTLVRRISTWGLVNHYRPKCCPPGGLEREQM